MTEEMHEKKCMKRRVSIKSTFLHLKFQYGSNALNMPDWSSRTERKVQKFIGKSFAKERKIKISIFYCNFIPKFFLTLTTLTLKSAMQVHTHTHTI
jgi:hypothetical protein